VKDLRDEERSEIKALFNFWIAFSNFGGAARRALVAFSKQERKENL